jgi:hypothetical protein
MKRGKYTRAVEAKRKFITHMTSEGTIDHQIRRAFLEIICIQIAALEFKAVGETLNQFNNTGGS